VRRPNGAADPWRNAMKPALMLASCAFLALQIGTAAAGPCTGEIESVSKILAAKDAGSGPTATANPGQHPPTAAMSAADPSTTASTSAAKSNQQQQPPTAAMTSAATNLDTGAPAARPREQHPPASAMDQTAHGSAAAGASGKADASAALERARNLDKAGQEAQCMDAVQQAKKLAGS
jgi:hypothetical protein